MTILAPFWSLQWSNGMKAFPCKRDGSASHQAPTLRVNPTTTVSIPVWQRQILILACWVTCGFPFVPSQPSRMSGQSFLYHSRPESMLAAYSRSQWIAQGMDEFRQGKIVESIASFDQCIPPSSSTLPYLWQRGISLYYANEFQTASDQFRADVLVSPLDVEEIVWDTACLLQLHGGDAKFPPTNQLSLPPGKQDRRPIMGVVYQLFRGQASEADVMHKVDELMDPSTKITADFYAALYLGLYCESRGWTTKAESYMRTAAQSKYARLVGSRDYMVGVAKAHCQLRHWVY